MAAREWQIEFPWEELASDPFERWLLQEAVMSYYQAEVDEAQRTADRRAEAQAKAKAALGR